MNDFLKNVRALPVPRGSAVLWWMGQMGLLVKMGQTVICIDYFASRTPDRQVPPPIPMEEMAGIDAFLGTHDHLDHMDHGAWKTWARCCPESAFVFPRIHLPAVLADGAAEKNCRGLNDGESCVIGDVTIRAVPAAHEFLDRDEETGMYPFLQYIIEGNGIRIWHAGDTVRYEGMMPKLHAFGQIDAALLPINGRDGRRYRGGYLGNMTFQESVDLAAELKLRAVIPGHWDMFAENPGDPEAFADYMDAKYPGRVQVIRPGILQPVWVDAAGAHLG